MNDIVINLHGGVELLGIHIRIRIIGPLRSLSVGIVVRGGHWGTQYRNTVRKIGKYRNTVSKIDEIPIPHL